MGWHVGVISFGEGALSAPKTVKVQTYADSGGSSTGNTFVPPVGMSVGDVMVACVEGGTYSAGSGWTLHKPVNWTIVHEQLVLRDSEGTVHGGDWIGLGMYSKIADAADVARTTSYYFGFSASGSLSGTAIAYLSWPAQNGNVLSNGNADSYDLSVPSPGGDWQLAFVTERTSSRFAQPTPNPVITSTPHNLLVDRFGSYRSGAMRVYAMKPGADPITGALLQGGIDFNRAGVVAASVGT